jgi:hypothetical protein
MPYRRLASCLVFAFFSVLILLVFALAAQQNRTLVVTGHPGELPVMEMGGRSYVEIEALTRLANGFLSFKDHQIVLTLPSSGSNAQATVAPEGHTATTGFTKEFVRAGIEEMASIREWRIALVNAIRQTYPVTEDWIAGFRGEAQQNLRLASVAASNESDRNALQLLTNEFNNMKALTNKFMEANRSRNYIPPDALDNDPLDQKILKCGHALAAMAANNQFVDDGSCH